MRLLLLTFPYRWVSRGLNERPLSGTAVARLSDVYGRKADIHVVRSIVDPSVGVNVIAENLQDVSAGGKEGCRNDHEESDTTMNMRATAIDEAALKALIRAALALNISVRATARLLRSQKRTKSA
jgi:hypothetical protein